MCYFLNFFLYFSAFFYFRDLRGKNQWCPDSLVVYTQWTFIESKWFIPRKKNICCFFYFLEFKIQFFWKLTTCVNYFLSFFVEENLLRYIFTPIFQFVFFLFVCHLFLLLRLYNFFFAGLTWHLFKRRNTKHVEQFSVLFHYFIYFFCSKCIWVFLFVKQSKPGTARKIFI